MKSPKRLSSNSSNLQQIHDDISTNMNSEDEINSEEARRIVLESDEIERQLKIARGKYRCSRCGAVKVRAIFH